jgi:pimeloyl-ACP methyl ester carboxylesterase
VPAAELHVVRHHVDAPGLPVLLVHGAPDRGKNFAHVVHLLGRRPVTVYDRRGYGKSLEAGGDGVDFDAHAEDLIEVLDGRPSVVVGQSAGGAISLVAATKAPELFLSLGMWEPPMTPWDWWPPELRAQTTAWATATDSMALGESFNRSMLGDDRFEQLSERTRALLRAEGAAFRADMASQARPFADLEKLIVPTIVGCGTATIAEGSPFEGLHAEIATRLGCELLVIEGATHSAHTTQPESWVQLVFAAIELAGGDEPAG